MVKPNQESKSRKQLRVDEDLEEVASVSSESNNANSSIDGSQPPPPQRRSLKSQLKRSIKIVGQTGDYQICKILAFLRNPLDMKPHFRAKNGGFLWGMELRTCEWMTKEMRQAFPGNNPCIAVVSVNRGLARHAGFRPKDILCWPTKKLIDDADKHHYQGYKSSDSQEHHQQQNHPSTAWELMNETQLRDSFKWFQVKGQISFYVARKLSAMDIEILLMDANADASDTKNRSKAGFKKARTDTNSILPSNNINGVAHSISDSPANNSNAELDTKPQAPILPVHSIAKHQLRPNHDIVLGRPGFCGSVSSNIYQATLTRWWERYENASHTEKVQICKMVIADMIAQGCRFLSRIDDGSRHGFYEVVPSTSESIRKKVLRALRQEVLCRTDHLTPEQKTARQQAIDYRKSRSFNYRSSVTKANINAHVQPDGAHPPDTMDDDSHENKFKNEDDSSCPRTFPVTVNSAAAPSAIPTAAAACEPRSVQQQEPRVGGDPGSGEL